MAILLLMCLESPSLSLCKAETSMLTISRHYWLLLSLTIRYRSEMKLTLLSQLDRSQTQLPCQEFIKSPLHLLLLAPSTSSFSSTAWMSAPLHSPWQSHQALLLKPPNQQSHSHSLNTLQVTTFFSWLKHETSMATWDQLLLQRPSMCSSFQTRHLWLAC